MFHLVKRYTMAAGVALVSTMPLTSMANDGLQLEEIIVTAQKRAQSLQDVAGSISALGAQQIEDRGINTVEDLALSVPGLSYSEQSGAQLITIRGIGLAVDTGLAEPGVATHIDGIYLPRSSMGALDFVDLDRAEVLRGPQGTLYGRNATGGVVNFITQKPTDEFQGQVTAGIGSWGGVKANGYVSGPLVDGKLSGRLSASLSEHDGYIDNLYEPGDDEVGDRKDVNVRAALRYTPADNLLIDLSASHQENEFHVINQTLDLSKPSSVFELVGLFNGVLRTDEPNKAVAINHPDGERDTSSVTLSVDWDVNDAVKVKSLTGYIDHSQGPFFFTSDGASSAEFFAVGLESDPRVSESESFSQEFNFSGTAFDDKLDWVVGTYYFQEDFDTNLPIYVQSGAELVLGAGIAPGIALDLINQDLQEDIESKAIFADVTYSLADNLRVNLGLRYSKDEKDVQQRLASTISNATPSTIGLFGGAVPLPAGASLELVSCDGFMPAAPSGDNELSWSSTSPKIRFEWDVNEDVLLYAQWQEGFKTGGINISSCDDTFDPEEITAWETGFKTTLFDNRVTLNGATYFYQYEGLQVLTFDETGTSANVENVPESEIIGAELDLVWLISDAFSIDGSIAYNDTEITDAEPSFDSVASVNNLLLGITDPAFSVFNPTGNPLPRSPELTAALGLNWEHSTDAGDFNVRGEIAYTDEIQYRLFDNPEDVGDSYTVGNVFVTYTNPAGAISVRGFVKNVTDEEYLYQILHSRAGGKFGVYAPPRSWGLEVTYRF